MYRDIQGHRIKPKQFRERIKLERLTEFKTSKSTETKTWFQCKDTQKNETEWISEINLNSFGRLILDKGIDAFQ